MTKHGKPATSKAKTAVGLKYRADNKQQAPQVIAKGFGELAGEIIALAEENGVLIHQDEQLSAFLAQLDLGQEIPDALYHVIAELIAFSYLLQGKVPEGWQAPAGHFHQQG